MRTYIKIFVENQYVQENRRVHPCKVYTICAIAEENNKEYFIEHSYKIFNHCFYCKKDTVSMVKHYTRLLFDPFAGSIKGIKPKGRRYNEYIEFFTKLDTNCVSIIMSYIGCKDTEYRNIIFSKALPVYGNSTLDGMDEEYDDSCEKYDNSNYMDYIMSIPYY